MKHSIATLVGLAAASCLTACGGGASETSAVPSAVPSSIQRYAGNYVSACEFADGVVNLDQGGQVYVLTYSTVTALSASVGSFTYRFDFYADAQCSSMPLGSVENSDPGNRVSILGAIRDANAAADQIQYDIRPSSTSYVLSGTTGTAIVGNAIHLAMPLAIFQAWRQKELWRLDSGRLYEGGPEAGADGFPLQIDPAFNTAQVSEIPPAPPQPCASQALTWTSGTASCSASLPLSVSSSRDVWMEDTTGPATGRASASCVNGAWTAPVTSSCTDSTPRPPDCTARTWTWTVDGRTCSGTSPDNYGNGNQIANNVIPGYMGSKLVSCVASPDGGYEWTEFVFPGRPTTKMETCDAVVVSTPSTDPLQLLTDKNCMMCHSVSTGGGGFLSFETIAAHYRNNPPAAGVLESKIKAGGMGVFLNFPMPANPQISDSELAIVVPWILSR